MARSRFSKKNERKSGAQARRMGAARIAAAGRVSDASKVTGRRLGRSPEAAARRAAAESGRGFTSGPRGGATRNQRNIARQVSRAIGEGGSH